MAVLPFVNLSGDVEQEYFCDGVTEDIITELSRFKSLFVIARNSSFSYKGRSPDVRQVGKELGVRYVLTNAQAVDTALQRVRFDMNCPSATGQVLSRQMIQPVSFRFGVERAEYTVGVEGCGQRQTIIVVCPRAISHSVMMFSTAS